MTTRELAERVVEVAGRGRVPATIPLPLARAMAAAGQRISRVIRRPPMLSKGQLHYLQWQARADTSKARRELGWERTPLDEGLRNTLSAMNLVEKRGER